MSNSSSPSGMIEICLVSITLIGCRLGLGCITLGGEGEARVVTVRTMSTLSKLSECHLAISARLVAN